MSEPHPYEPSPRLLLRVREQAERWGYHDPDSALEAALDLLDGQPAPSESLEAAQKDRIRVMIQAGVDDLEAGRIVDSDDALRGIRARHQRIREAAESGAA